MNDVLMDNFCSCVFLDITLSVDKRLRGKGIGEIMMHDTYKMIKVYTGCPFKLAVTLKGHYSITKRHAENVKTVLES